MALIIVLIAFLDNMAQQPLISPFAESLGASGLLAGLIFGAYSISNILGNMISPRLVERKGLKTTLAWAFLAVGLFLFLYSRLQTPLQMLALRVGHGFAGGIVVPCIFTHISYGKNYGLRMSTVGRVIGLAAVLGPGLAGVASGVWGYRAPFLILGLLYLVSLPLVTRLSNQRESLETTGALHTVWANDGLRIAYVSAFCLMFAMGMLGFWFPLQMQAFGFSGGKTGTSFLVFGVSAIAVMRLGAIKAMGSPITTICSGFALIFVGIAFLSFVETLPWVLLAMSIYGGGFGLVFPAANILVVRETTARDRASAFAVFHGFFSLAVFIAAVIGGIVHRLVHPFYVVLLILLVSSMTFFRVGVNYVRRPLT